MKRDEIIRMAVERHMANFPANCKNAAVEVAELVAETERDACIKDVLSIANDDAGNPYKQALRIGVEAIRTRGQKETA